MSNSTTFLGKIIEKVVPPEFPPAPGSAREWSIVEKHLGITFPADYKKLICLYGSGFWGNFLSILNPFSANRYIDSIEIVEKHLYWLEPEFAKIFPGIHQAELDRIKNSPYPFYPEPGCLFPWADAENTRLIIYWLTEGDPEKWPIVIEYWECLRYHYQKYEMSCSEFLFRWLFEELRPLGFPASSSYEKEELFTLWGLDCTLEERKKSDRKKR